MADASPMTTTVEVPPAVETVYQRFFFMDPSPKYIYAKYAQKESIARRSGNTLKFRKLARLSAKNVPVTQGVTPPADQLSIVDLTATLSQYIGVIVLTDIVDMTVEDPMIAKAVVAQNDQMHNTVDQLCRDYLVASASSVTCSHGSPTVTLLNDTDIRAVVNTLRGNDAEFITPMIKAGTGQGTAPVRPAFIGMADTDLEDDLEDVAGFKHVTNYSAQSGVDTAEYGTTPPVRWLTSSQGYVSGGTYTCPILGKNAYCMVDLKGGNAKNIIKGFGSGDDPANQRATVAWKMMQAIRILQDLFVIALNCTNAS